jgi:trehalose 6-phosphate phosphatase
VRYILAQSQRAVLEQLCWSNVLLGFDFDGTLCPIVRDPDRAVMRASTHRLLAELARIYPVVVISGRSLSDVRARLTDLELAGVIGNHGLEPGHATRTLERTVEHWKAVLAEELADLPGVVIEDKHYSIAVHYRRARRKGLARASIARALARLDDVRIVGGKQVVNLLPPGAPHKGVALERERGRLGCDTALFVGDDETDEDVFALERPGRLVSIRVGPARSSQASYCLKSQDEIDTLLRALINLRRDAVHRRAAMP